MKKLGIVFKSTHGTTQSIANYISERITGFIPVQLNLDFEDDVEIGDYDAIIIGASVHFGGIPAAMEQFIHDNKAELLGMPVALFQVCMDKEKSKEQFENNFPEWLRAHSIVNVLAGGEFRFEEMNLFEKITVRLVAGKKESVSEINYPEINRMIRAMSACKLNYTQEKEPTLVAHYFTR